jgi:dihydrofolate reductase
MAAYWPTSSDQLAAPMNEIPKVVFSRKGAAESGIQRAATPSAAADSWTNARVAGGDLAEEIAALKKEEGKYILAHGGARFAQSLARFGLIDEYRLVVHPVVLGRGLPLFGSIDAPADLKLESSVVLPNGVIANTYTPLIH